MSELDAPTPQSPVTGSDPEPLPLSQKAEPSWQGGESDWQITWRQFKKNPVGIAGLVVVYLLFAIAVFAPLTANGLPFYMRGVVTLFYDSDVTALRDLTEKVAERSATLAAEAAKPEEQRMKLRERDKLRGQLARYKQQIPEVLERLSEVVPGKRPKVNGRPAPSPRQETQRLGDRLRELLAAPPATFEAAKYKAVCEELDDVLSQQSFALLYKKATALAIAVEFRSLDTMMATLDELTGAAEDEDAALVAELGGRFREAAERAKAASGRLEVAYQALGEFLNESDRAALSAVTQAGVKALAAIPTEVPAVDDPDEAYDIVDEFRTELNDKLDAFKTATRTVDKRFARVAIDPSKQKLPQREYYPAIRYLGWGEVLFLVLYLAVTVCLVMVWVGAWPGATPRLVVLASIGPALAAGLLWWAAVPARNPPPATYYKRFAEDLDARRAEYRARRAAGATNIPDPGAILLAPVPFGENENISSDAKTPPTWAESIARMRSRLLTSEELRADETTFKAPDGWVEVDAKGPGRSFEVAGRGEGAVATVRAFPLKGSGFASGLVSSAEAFKALFDPEAEVKGLGTRFLAVRESGLVDWQKAPLGEVVTAQLRSDKRLALAAWLRWPEGQGPNDGPWGLEMIGPPATVEVWASSFLTFSRSARSSMDAEIRKRSTRREHYHWLGTDENGRDVLSRMIYGSRVSLSVGFIAVGIYVVLGIIIGALAGFFRGWTDIAISRVIEVVICFPSFFLIITVLAMFPPSIVTIMVVIGMTRWTGVARLIRGEFLRLVNLDFVVACDALGFPAWRTIFRHIVPNALAPVLVAATFGVAGAILTESALSYLGFGVPQPQASWGSILQEASSDPKQLWWITVFPGLAIFITITAYNIVGEAFRDASDPKLRK